MDTEKDKIVDELFEIVQKKKEEIKQIEKPTWITNCSFISPLNVNNNRQNLRVVSNVSELVSMVSTLLLIKDYNKKSCEILGVDSTTMVSWDGYKIDDWISDIKTRVSILNINEKKKSLMLLEKRLDRLVSKEKREEMELEAIRKELEG